MFEDEFPYVPIKTQHQAQRPRRHQLKIMLTDEQAQALDQATVQLELGNRQDVVLHAISYYFATSSDFF